MNTQTFGPFIVLEKLGEGGMGEVYRARDTRLNRDVALKFLSPSVVGDPERLARFTREAQVLASLNHPNIGGIHGLEEAGGRQALVLELVEGPTLADRIAQGPLPVDEALDIGRQIAEAVEAAHDQGIVHRDLKPANIKLRPDGTVKVLDFGLAKAAARLDRTSVAARVDVTASPTMLSPATMTNDGLILGTAAYMAPEQARGKAVDRRADIWAFGCVLFEMLAGRRAFEGDAVTDTLAGILRGKPDWQALPATTPPAIRRLLRRCFEKDPRQRLQSIGDGRIEIAEAALAGPDSETVAAVTPALPRRRNWIPIVAGLLTPIAAFALAWKLKSSPPAIEPRVTRTIVAMDPFDQRPLKPGETRAGLTRTSRTGVAISPDGRTLVFRGVSGNAGWLLYLRPLDTLTTTPIPNTSGADNPFFSPDGQWIAYADGGELRRVPAAGGSVSYTSIAKLPAGVTRIWGATWGDDDQIVLSTGDTLWRVPASGGTPALLAKTRDDEAARMLPHLLPGSRVLLFTSQKTVFRWDDTQVIARTLASGDERVLLSDAMDARYVSSGHLVFMRRGRLMAVPFDPDRLEVTGAAVAVVDEVMQSINWGNSGEETGAGQFAIGPQGTLVYVTGGVPPDEDRELVWVDRTGVVTPVAAPIREYVAPRISPDGQQVLAFTSGSDREGGMRLWSYDVGRRTSTPVTSLEERASWGVWSPDGARVAFESLRPGGGILSIVPVGGSAKAESPSVDAVAPAPSSWSRDGLLVFVDPNETTGTDIWVLDTRTGQAQAAVRTPADDRLAVLSADGKWLAYNSDESGSTEVYVQPYPGPGARALVSSAGGFAPTWRADGTELFYYTNTDGVLTMYAVSTTAGGAGLIVGAPRRLFSGKYVSSTPNRGYDVAPDGQRFVMVRTIDRPATAPAMMVLVENWFAELTRRVPVH